MVATKEVELKLAIISSTTHDIYIANVYNTWQ